MFSKECEYGIKAAIFVAMQSEKGAKVGLDDIVKHIDSPLAFTAKILQKLSRNKIISSQKGPAGGFEIREEGSAKTMLSEIVKAIDGDSIYKGCGLGFNACNELKPCPLHHKFKSIRDDLKSMLETTSLQDLSRNIKDGFTFLKT